MKWFTNPLRSKPWTESKYSQTRLVPIWIKRIAIFDLETTQCRSPRGGRPPRTPGGPLALRMALWSAFQRVALAEGARETVSLRGKYLFFFQTRDCMTSTLQDFYIESVTAHRIKINDHSCFHNSWPNSKSKLKWKHLWEQGGPLVFRGPYAACVFCV